jgi:hypothetical protein
MFLEHPYLLRRFRHVAIRGRIDEGNVSSSGSGHCSVARCCRRLLWRCREHDNLKVGGQCTLREWPAFGKQQFDQTGPAMRRVVWSALTEPWPLSG